MLSQTKRNFISSFTLVATLGTTYSTQAATIEFRGTGANATTAFADYRTAIGGVNNGATPGSVGSGFRTINWDGVPLDGSNPIIQTIVPDKVVGIPEDLFLSRGTLYDEVYMVSGDGFESVNQGVVGQFPAFSPTKTFAHFGADNNEIDQSFTVPGSFTSAGTRGFGAIFLDVELANTSFIEYFSGSTSLGKFFVDPANSGEPSFLGVLFDSPIVTRVEMNLGNNTIFDLQGNTIISGPADDPQNGTDLVIVDDFVYAEPVQVNIPEPSSVVAISVLGLLGGTILKRHRKS
jgi:hypothetical protein